MVPVETLERQMKTGKISFIDRTRKTDDWNSWDFFSYDRGCGDITEERAADISDAVQKYANNTISVGGGPVTYKIADENTAYVQTARRFSLHQPWIKITRAGD